MKAILRAGAALLVMTGSSTGALAQRAVETPSSETAAVGPAPPPPPGMMPGLCGSDIVCGGELVSQLQALAVNSGGRKAAAWDDSNLDLYANYSSWLSLYATVKLERNRTDNLDSYYPQSSGFFRSEALTLPQLFVAVRPFSGLTLYGGKIHPNFGSAYDQEPGQFYNFGSDYEQDERIGVGAEYLLPEAIAHRLRISVESFFLDTSFLSESLLSRPGFSTTDPTARPFRYTLRQFGPSNTESLSSYTVALRGGEADRGLTYQISFTKEATEDPTAKTEYGESIGAQYDPTGDGMRLTDRLGLTPFLEYVHFNNFATDPDLERHYLIGGLQFNYVRWQVILAGGVRRTDDSSNPPGLPYTNAVGEQERHAWDHQENVSVNYTLPIAISYNLTVGGGVNHTSIAGRSSWAFGPSVNLNVKF